MKRYAVIPTYNRPSELQQLTQRLMDNDVTVVIIDNGSNPAVADTLDVTGSYWVVEDAIKPPRLYQFWNTGLALIEQDAVSLGVTEWNVGIFNDDASVPPNWWNVVEDALRAPLNPAVACTHAYCDIVAPMHHTQQNEMLFHRMCPWAFMVRGELKLRADESFKWWWGDTDFEWQATSRGGVYIVPGPRVTNLHADQSTVGELHEQAGRDGVTFLNKWGRRPW